MFQIPFLDNSIDLVYTSHSIEPNGGREEEILKELYRITRRYLILLEPGYEFTTEEGRKRMEHHGYCQGLAKKSKKLGYKVIRNQLFPVIANPLNPTALTIIEKAFKPMAALTDSPLTCQIHRTSLIQMDDSYFSPEAVMAYLILGGVPCLRADLGILASKKLD